MKDSDQSKGTRRRRYLGVSIAISVGAGAAIGSAIDQMGAALGWSVVIGVTIGALIDNRLKRSRP